jgi:hypothetical protein
VGGPGSLKHYRQGGGDGLLANAKISAEHG